MAKANHDIYGPDLSIHEAEGKAIAAEGMKCMKGTGVTDEQDKSTGPDTSINGLERVTALKDDSAATSRR